MRDLASAIFSAILRRSPTILMSSTAVVGRQAAACPGDLRPARQERVDVLMGDAAGRTAAGDLAQVDAGFPGAQPHGRRGQRLFALGARRSRRGGGAVPASGAAAGAGFGAGSAA